MSRTLSEKMQLKMISQGQFYSVDLGKKIKGGMAIHGPDGPVNLSFPPKAFKGLNSAEKQAERFRVLLHGEPKDLFGESLPALPVVTEASTPGTSGIEPVLLVNILSGSEYDLWKIACRAVKNHRKDTVPPGDDGKLPECSDPEAARIIHKLSQDNTDRLSVFKLNTNPVTPKCKSVRPYDKRDYQDPEVYRLIDKLPPMNTLCPDLQLLLGDKKGYKGYRGHAAFPLAQSLDEGANTRKEWEKLVGLWSNGRPCHYRRNIEEIRQLAARILAGGVKKNSEVSPQIRKESQILVRRLLREFYHLAQGTTDPVKGTTHPASSGSSILVNAKSKLAESEFESLLEDDS